MSVLKALSKGLKQTGRAVNKEIKNSDSAFLKGISQTAEATKDSFNAFKAKVPRIKIEIH